MARRRDRLIAAFLLLLATASTKHGIDGFAPTLSVRAPHALPTKSMVFTPRLMALQLDMSMDAENESGVSSPSTSSNDKTASSPTSNKKPNVKCPNCDQCDGSGRIAGGIGAVIPWIPVKAFRPCPNFINRGGTYERAGQGLDEIAFGRDSTFQK